MAVSLDFISTQLERLLAELREVKTTADIDRRNFQGQYNNLAAETARQIGLIDAKLEIAVAHLDERLDGVEARLGGVEARLDGLDIRLDRIEILLQRIANG